MCLLALSAAGWTDALPLPEKGVSLLSVLSMRFGFEPDTSAAGAPCRNTGKAVWFVARVRCVLHCCAHADELRTLSPPSRPVRLPIAF